MLLFKALALVASASAALVVPEVSQPKEGDDTLSTLPVDTNVGPDVARTVYKANASIPCKSCAGLDAHIEVSLAIKDGFRLTLNDYDAWPDRDPSQGDTMAVVKAFGLTYTEKIEYVLLITRNKDTGIKRMMFKIIRVGETNPVSDIPIFSVRTIEVSPRRDIAMLGGIRIGEVPKAQKQSAGHRKHQKGNQEEHKEHKEHKGGMKMHHHHKGDKDEKKKEKEFDEGCKSKKCYFEQSVDQMWAEVGCYWKGHKCTHDESKDNSPNPNAGPHLDTDSGVELVKAIFLFALFLLFVSLIATLSFAMWVSPLPIKSDNLLTVTSLLSPLILIVYMVWIYERKNRLAKSRSSNKAADVEAEEGEKSGLLADENDDDAPPQYVLANESDSESDSESEYERDSSKA